MNKKTLKVFFSVCLSLVIAICIIFYFYNLYFNQKNKRILLNLANQIISEEVVNLKSNDKSEENQNKENLVFSVDEIDQNKKIFPKDKENKNIIGKIKIEKLGVEAPILDGTSADILKISVGHFKSTSYWDGNVALASHNRGSYAHYFEKINELCIGDELQYQTKLGTRIYYVYKTEQISEDDVSILKNTKDNTLTLITCVKNDKNLRFCVRAIEKI